MSSKSPADLWLESMQIDGERCWRVREARMSKEHLHQTSGLALESIRNIEKQPKGHPVHYRKLARYCEIVGINMEDIVHPKGGVREDLSPSKGVNT